MTIKQLNEIYGRFRRGEVDRRTLVKAAMAAGFTGATLSAFSRNALAQQASPTAGLGYRSITAAEFRAQLDEAMKFETAANTGGVVIYGKAISSPITTFNLLLAADDPTVPIMQLVFESLVSSSPIDGQYVPGLSDHWELADDGKTWTFVLREGIVWHDGTPLTADDVIFSMDAQADPDTTSAYTSAFTGAVASYRAVDDRTIELVATDVLAPVVFLSAANTPVVAKHIWESVAHADWRTDPGATGEDLSRVVGTGPFKLSEYNSSESIARFARNDAHYEQPPIIDEFVFQPWPDDTAAAEALRAAQIDVIQNVPLSDVESLDSEEHIDIAVYDTSAFSFYGHNLDPEKTRLWQDARTRQALAYAIDRQSIVDNIQFGYAEVAEGPQPVLSVAYAPDEIRTHYTFDPEKAKSLLDEAGWVDADGDGIREQGDLKLSFSLMFANGSPARDATAAYLKEAWKDIGVDMTPEPVSFGDVLIPAVTATFDYNVVMTEFGWDLTGDQSAMFSSTSYKTGFNFMRYSNPEVDTLNAEANRTVDPEKRRELLIESANLVNDDIPLNVLTFMKLIAAYNNRMHNFVPNWLGGILWSLPFVWVER